MLPARKEEASAPPCYPALPHSAWPRRKSLALIMLLSLLLWGGILAAILAF